MSDKTRYLFGYTKMDRLNVTNSILLDGLATADAPTAAAGMIYHDSTLDKLRFCADGTNYESVTTS